ncbi:MAG: signal peptidase I [Anaerolineales bacterium]|jgi:signal peptidase
MSTISSKGRSIRSARQAWIPVVIGLVVVYYSQTSSALQFINSDLRYYFIFPLLRILIAILALWGWHYDLREKPGLNPLIGQLAVSAGILEIIGVLLSGLLWGIGNSPYSHRFPTILGNISYFLSVLLSLEIARGYLLMRWSKGRPLAVFAFTVLFFAILALPLPVFQGLNTVASGFYTTGKTILPSLSHSLLLTYMVWTGGPGMAIIYRLFPLVYEFFAPFLPNLTWMQSGFVNTLLPIGILMLIHMATNQETRFEDKPKKPAYTWFYVASIAASLLWLNAGLLGFQTFLISGVSMEPTLEAGDVVIVKKSSPEDIEIGDLVLFNKSEKRVLHRVIEIRHSGMETEIISQGDANNAADEPIPISGVQGKAIFKIPKIGWLSLNLKRAFGWRK